MLNFLKKKREYRFSLSLWQLGSIAGILFLIPYVAWEAFWYTRVGMVAIKPHTWVVLALVIIWVLLAPNSAVDFIRKNLLLGLLYIALCLLIGEVHPFTKVRMYSKFVNYAYSFKLTDNNEKQIPIIRYYNLSSGGLSHKYFTLMDQHHQGYGYGTESPETLATAGRELLKELQQSKKSNPPADSLKLYLVYHYLRNDSLLCTEKLMYADRAIQ